MNKTLSSTQGAVTDAAHAVSHVASDTAQTVSHVATDAASVGADLVGDLAAELADLAEVAVDAAAATSKFGIRAASRTIRYVSRNPREVAGALVALLTVVAFVSYMRKRSNDKRTKITV